ncbi:hypothetical protein Asp14428_14860 [Actinoplanes sp. NBRC 14428]|uniref:Putative nucleotidyltransferase-like protein n=1 Tax=Pseudosporangium ferrugineum TaxID=439699 RepID=A0A2T0SAN5_9ACTN|nr:nucleotidyltransferase family protein [Pseudosporangium ferrugineum]PRY30478.1 putative nucleotidyltransferase-like protein [Pseudosporangium ferrugineum]BCJ50011.1 hypothetical protein Asp14428_14860 [Actinoplanes sp. NBRC 14428]
MTSRIDATTAECVAALNAAGVPQLLLKGPTVARWLYRDGTPRPYSDSDLLVPPGLHPRAQAVLEERGFVDRWAGTRPEAAAAYAVTLYRSHAGGPDEVVDLHRGLGLADPAAPVWEVLSRDAEELEVAGQRVRMPGEAGRCLVLAVQAAQDGALGAKALEDLRRGRRLAGADAWSRACALADELGVGPAARLACELVDAPLPGGAAGWHEVPLDLRLRVRGAARGAASVAGLREHRGRARLRYLFHRALPPRAFMAECYGARTAPALVRAHVRRLALMTVLLPRAVRDVAAAAHPPAPPGRDR